MSYDAAILIGRFQPFHQGHYALVMAALEHCQTLIILCGSANRAASTRDPWDYPQRKAAILACFSADIHKHLIILPLNDHLYQPHKWLQQVQQQVASVTTATTNIAVLENTAYPSPYPDLFPQWQSLRLSVAVDVSGSQIRKALFSQAALSNALPAAIDAKLSTYQQTSAYQRLCQEAAFVRHFKQSWATAPYPPIFQTVDALVVQSGHILLIERLGFPGKGLLALPGGFLDPQEPLLEACLRELHEETCIDLSQASLRAAVKTQALFDAPFRSARGRTLTQAYLLELPASRNLAKVKGADDAARAFWQPLASLRPETLLEDHYFIIEKMLAI